MFLHVKQVHVRERGTFFSMKVIQKGYLFCESGIEKGNGLDLGAESPYTKLAS